MRARIGGYLYLTVDGEIQVIMCVSKYEKSCTLPLVYNCSLTGKVARWKLFAQDGIIQFHGLEEQEELQ